MDERMFNSFEEQLDFEVKIGLCPSRRPHELGVAFGALQAELDASSEDVPTEETLGNVRKKLLGVVTLTRTEIQA